MWLPTAGKTLQGKKPRKERAIAVKQASWSIGLRTCAVLQRSNSEGELKPERGFSVT
jgi:hypothetical protein